MRYRNFFAKLRENGASWGVRRLLYEARDPITPVGKIVRNGLAAAEATLRKAAPKRSDHQVADTLYAFYDLEVLPHTFDVATFVALADLERKRRALKRLHVIIVPAPDPNQTLVNRGWRPPEFNHQRILGILLPVLHLAPSCQGKTVCATRSEAAIWRFSIAEHVFPADYTPSFPRGPIFAGVRAPELTPEKVFPLLQAGNMERNAVAEALRERIGTRAPIVISLRESRFNTLRNSNIEAWVAFADSLDQDKYAAVFVRDTDRAFDRSPPGLERHATFEAASWNCVLRMALYELAYLNLAIMHGSMELCWYNEACRYVAFMPVGTSPQTTPEFLQLRGFRSGQSLPFARPWQRLAWAPDDQPNIASEFAGMQEIIGPPPQPPKEHGAERRPIYGPS